MDRRKGSRSRVIDSVEAAAGLFASAFSGARDERLYVAHLCTNKRLIGIRIRYASARRQVDFPLRAIIHDAVGLGSAELVLAHNHPSGDAEPSATDINATRSLIRIAGPLGVKVRDHLVFGGGSYVSLRQRGLL